LLLLCVAFFLAVGGARGAPAVALSPNETAQAVQSAVPAPRDLVQLAEAYRGLRAVPQIVNADQPSYEIGRRDSFWISTQNPPTQRQSSATLQLIGRHAYWYVQDGFSAPDDALQRNAAFFDDQTYPRVRQLVGSEPFPGIDNDPRITIFLGDVPQVAGYVTASDTVPTAVHPYSNERDMVYLNLRALKVGQRELDGTLAHEFTHLVHGNVNAAEDTWVKEGLAELVSSIVVPDRPEHGLPSSAFASLPDLQLSSWSDPELPGPPVAAHYQAGSWFLRYFVDRFGDGALQPLLSRPAHGPANFDGFLADRGLGLSFADLFADWTVANLVGQRTDSTVWSYRSSQPTVPRTRPIAVGDTVHDTVAQFGTDYFEMQPARPFTLAFSGSTVVPVVGTEPIGGDAMWFGGRADGAVATMTRDFDLTTVSAPTLTYDAWYDLEHQYDYAYLSASTDGGHTWTLLGTPAMERENPSGNGLGVGYTGHSGGGSEAQWIHEFVDLSQFDGETVRLAFSYITDDAVTHEGIVLDNVRLDAVGYDDHDPTAGPWSLQGWTRVGPAILQTWSVQVVEFAGSDVRVSRVPVSESGEATWSTSAAGDRKAVVLISGTAPVTLELASYQLSFR
jgi:hypothetical protein